MRRSIENSDGVNFTANSCHLMTTLPRLCRLTCGLELAVVQNGVDDLSHKNDDYVSGSHLMYGDLTFNRSSHEPRAV